MIEVELFEGSFGWENEEPTMLLSLREYEERINNGDDTVRDIYKIRFVIR